MEEHWHFKALAVSVGVLLTMGLAALGAEVLSPAPVAGRSLAAVASTTTTAPVTTTTTSTTTTTPTTVPPPPTTAVTATREVTVTQRAQTPAAAPAPAPMSVEQRCAESRSWDAAHGLVLPAGWGFRCPDANPVDGTDSHWGTTCINVAGACPGTAYVAINVGLIGPSQDRLHYVMAHELCHANELATTGHTTEDSADACAAAHGAPRV